jgi:hypothetical protein
MIPTEVVDALLQHTLVTGPTRGCSADTLARVDVRAALSARRHGPGRGNSGQDRLILQPLWFANHFVAVTTRWFAGDDSKTITAVTDSLTGYATLDRKHAVSAITPVGAKLVFRRGPQQAASSNDCAFFALRALDEALCAFTGGTPIGWTRSSACTWLLAERQQRLTDAQAAAHLALEAIHRHLNVSVAASARAPDDNADAPLPDAIPMTAPTPAHPCAALNKHGGSCSAPAVGFGLCRMHLLLSRRSHAQCAATSKAHRPCSHPSTSGLAHCTFHVRDDEFAPWLEQLLAAPPVLGPPPPAAPALAVADALADANDPDFEDELAELAAIKTETLSWTGPPPTANDGSWAELRAHLLSKGNPAHPLAFHFLHAETWKRHIRMIKTFLIPETAFDSWPAVTALLKILERRRRSRQWAWTSMCRAMAETQGAFNNLPILGGTAPIRLCDFPAWVQALKGAASRARSERPRTPFAATAASIDTAMASTNHLGKKRLFALSWLLAGRTGDCRQLREDDISRDGNVLTVTFRRFQGVDLIAFTPSSPSSGSGYSTPKAGKAPYAAQPSRIFFCASERPTVAWRTAVSAEEHYSDWPPS